MTDLTRRSLLGAAAAGAVVGSATFTAEPARATAPGVTPTTAPGAILGAVPTRADWIAFAKTLTGPVLLPGSTAYAAAKQLFDTRYDGSAPAAIVQVASQSDVQKSMAFATRYAMQVSARGGGHSYVGASAANGTLVLDTRHYAAVKYNAATQIATVYSGAGLYNVHATLASYGRTIPTGTCPTVGAAGLTLGGGVGIESRAVGLTCDRLVSATVVLADGTAMRVSPTSHADILWALRGGGGGNVAFVTSLDYATHAATSKGIFQLTFPATSPATSLARWSTWMRGHSTSWWSNFHVTALGGGRVGVSVVGATPAGQERSAAASLISAVGLAPTRTAYYEKSYMDTVRFFGGGTTSPRQPFTAGSDVLASVSQAAATQVVAAVAARSRAGGGGVAIVDPIDGAVGMPSATATAFPWRDHAATVQWYVGGSGYGSASGWLTQAHALVRGYSSGGYVNYLESGQPASRYYGSNFARLQSIRRTYDPARRLYSGASF